MRKAGWALIAVAIALTSYSLTVLIVFEARGGAGIVSAYHEEYEGGGSCKWRFLSGESNSNDERYSLYQFMKTWCIWMYPAAWIALALSLVGLFVSRGRKPRAAPAVVGLVNLGILVRCMWVGVLSAAMSWC
jgi:hypothetical protein